MQSPLRNLPPRMPSPSDLWRAGFHKTRSLGISLNRFVVEAAVQGQGVALVRLSLAADDLAAGRLILPFPRVERMPTARSYFLVMARRRTIRPEVQAFADWMRKEIASLRELGL